MTLIELVVAIAILALLGTAIVGIMGSNTSIFRKNKADIKVQTTAEETYNRITEDIMQAKYIYVEGYSTDKTVPFDDLTMDIGKDLTSEDYSMQKVGLFKASDLDLIHLSNANAGVTTDACQVFTKNFTANTVTDRSAVYETYYNSLSPSDKQKADDLFNSLLYMDSVEASNYGYFVDYVLNNQGDEAISFFDFSNPTIVADKSTTPYKFNNIYITRIIVGYSAYVNPNDSSLSTSDKSKIKYYDTDDAANDFCISEYAFNGNEITYSSKYMVDSNKNTDSASDKVLSKVVNYANVSAKPDLSGVVANIDASNESIGLKIYFNDKNRTYKSDGVTYIRNSYVLHDAK